MIDKWELTIPELTGDKTRRAYVYLPDWWEEGSEERFPVLYMFDGHNVFFDDDATYGKSWGLSEYLTYTDTPLIVAAVECNHDPNNGRLAEYSPYPFRYNHARVPGLGKITMDWFTQVFKPEIDQNFPTRPGREDTFIAGSSMGGLMSLHALLVYIHICSRAAALAPSLWVTPGKLTALIRSAHPAPGSVLYMDYGSQELANHPHMLRDLGKAAQLLLEKDIYLDFRIVPGGDHSEASWERQVPFFINTLLYGRE